MPDEPDASDGIAQHIPHLWFDIIGRIIPGAFLLGGVVEATYATCGHDALKAYIGQFSRLGLGAGVLAFTVGAWITGFLLSQISHPLFKYGWLAVRWIKKPSTVSLPSSIVKFLPPHLKSESEKTDFCFHYLWTRSRGGPIVTLASKRDAEALASKSLSTGALMLVLFNFYPFGTYRSGGVYLFYAVVALLGLRASNHYERRKIQTRLDGIVSLLDKDDWK
jgi:hypothetical protein